MGSPLPWTEAAWLERAHAWIDDRLERIGRPRTGPIEQPHARPWATALRVPTGGGDVWFKASIPALAHEAGVLLVLRRRRPELLTGLLAADTDTGWLLLEDAGDRLRELAGGEDDVVGRWEELLPLYVGLQQAAAGDVDELLAAGAPDRRLAVLPALYDRLLDDLAHGPELPGALTGEELARLRALAPRVAGLCAELAAHGVAETIQHDDLHDGQVFVRDGRYLILDWGDSCVGHPFFTLTVTLNGVAYRLGIERDSPSLLRVRDAYLDAWPGSAVDLRRAFETADLLGHVGRALAWRAVVEGIAAPAEEGHDDPSAAWLREFLDAAG